VPVRARVRAPALGVPGFVVRAQSGGASVSSQVTTHGPLARGRFALAELVPPPGTFARVLFDRARQALWLLVVVPLVCCVYVLFASAGLEDWPGYGDYHELTAEAFRAGRLHISHRPAPELLKAANPYDPVNMRYWLLDASYYQGKYYIYWGPVPALLLAIGKTVLGIRYGIGDQYIAGFFSCLTFVGGALLVERMGRLLFPALPRRYLLLGALVFAFANPMLHAVTTPSFYHVAIMSAQAWLLLGLVVALDVVWGARSVPARPFGLLLAGTAWSLAIASRVTVGLTVAVFVLATALAAGWSSPRRLLGVVRAMLLVAAPLVVVSVLLLIFNKVRFGSYLEFGTNVQLSAFPTFRVSSSYLWPNIYSYTLRPFETSCEFPYVFQAWRMGDAAFPKGQVLPKDYMILEPVVGWLRASPITWLIPLAFVLAPRPFDLGSVRHRAYAFLVATLSAYGMLTGLVGWAVYGATMRYLNDVSSGLMLLGLLGAFTLRTHRIGTLVPWVTGSLVALLSAATIFIGAALGYHGYNGHIERFNPAVHQKLVSALSVCGKSVPDVPRYHP
jgi:hypothetical protein